jgi:hypothetical protein
MQLILLPTVIVQHVKTIKFWMQENARYHAMIRASIGRPVLLRLVPLLLEQLNAYHTNMSTMLVMPMMQPLMSNVLVAHLALLYQVQPVLNAIPLEPAHHAV